jgi:hypothetical protein
MNHTLLPRNDAMHPFLQKHLSSVTGWLNGFDRLRCRGTLRMLSHTGGFASFLRLIGVKIKDFGPFVRETTERVCQASEAVARAAGRPVIYVPSAASNKEEIARQIMERDEVRSGLVCVLRCVEPCISYDVRKWGSPELKLGTRKCLHPYHYQVHPVFGFMHVRVQSWMPMTVHVYVNGREWLARRMDVAKLGYRRAGNCFTALSDPEEAQRLFDQLLRTQWPAALDELASAANPAWRDIFAKCPQSYYWSVDASEWATDVMFKTPELLAAVYPNLVRHGMLNLGSRDVLRFLGRKAPQADERGRRGQPLKLHARLTAEVNTDLAQRAEGVRIKHRVNTNSIKMYDKQGSVLRVETTLNKPRDMKVYRPKEGDEGGEKAWRYLRKGVADLWRRGQLCQSANERYLTAMATVDHPTPLGQLAEKLCRSTTWSGKPARGLNPLGGQDAVLLEAVNRGEFILTGFRNRDLRTLLYATETTDPKEARRRSGAVTRQLRLLRAHGLIHKVPKTHRYQVSENGRKAITALLTARAADTAKLAAAA